MELNAFDLVAIAVVLISSIMAFARGFVREVFSILALIGAAAAAYYGHAMVAPFLNGFFNSPTIAAIAAGLLLFIVTFVVITVLTSFLAKAVHKSGEIGAIDRGAGLLFGGARAVLALAILVFLAHKFFPADRRPDWLTQAKSYPVLSQGADAIESFLPQATDYINEHRRESGGAT